MSERVLPSGPSWPSGPILTKVAQLGDGGLRAEIALRVPGARLIFADYPLLQHDFPSLRDDALALRHPEIGAMEGPRRRAAIEARIDRWLLHHTAIISGRQAIPSGANTPIVTGEPVVVHRPSRYGRAVIVELEGAGDGGGGLLDLKGAGVSPDHEPSTAVHSNGLLKLGEMFHDLLFQWLFDAIFRFAQTEIWTVPIYGAVDLGFDAALHGGGTTPAGLQIRRAHRRPVGSAEIPEHLSPEEHVKLEIELLLRNYGITSANTGMGIHVTGAAGGELVVSFGDKPLPIYPQQQEMVRQLARRRSAPVRFDCVNVQLTREVERFPSRAQIVDFGHYEIRDRFEGPLVSLVRHRLLRLGNAIWPEDRGFIQPHPELRVPFATWGTVRGDEALKPGRVDVGARSYDLARRFRAGEIDGAAVRAELLSIIGEVTEKWRSL